VQKEDSGQFRFYFPFEIIAEARQSCIKEERDDGKKVESIQPRKTF
jgi:hypothetical protein